MKKNTILFISLLLISTLSFSQQRNIDYTLSKIEKYQKYAKTKVFFVPLEIGEITPQGWLLQWANRAAKGITGHLDEYQLVYKNGWKGFGFKAPGTNESDGTGWPIEQCSYWLDGATKLGYILRDSTLIHKTNERLNFIVNGVLNGSQTFIYWKPKSIIDTWFNNWGHGLMGRALVSYYQATHNPKILQALTKVYVQFPLIVPEEKGISDLNHCMDILRGATNIDAMSETYLMTGEKAILDSILTFSNAKSVKALQNEWMSYDYNKPTTEEQSAHGVSFYETLRIPAMMSLWTGDQAEINTTKHFLDWGEKKNLLPYGICSSEEFLAGIGCFRNTETCNVPTSMWTFLWMLRLTGQSNWCDKIENVFFNAGPAPVERDFKTMCYYQSPNRYSEKLPEPPFTPGNGKDNLFFTPYGHKVLCCVGNVNNTIPDYISNMWMETTDKGLACMLYGPCIVKKAINGRQVSISCNTAYPFNERINISFSSDKAVTMPLYFRIPNWCKNATIAVNKKAFTIKPVNGFVRISRTWRNNDKVVITFPMKTKITQECETSYPQIKYFKNTSAAANNNVNNPFEYITYGPLLFSFPIKDANANHVYATVPYNYALNINKGQLSKDIKVVKKPMPKDWSWQIGDAPICLQVKAKQFDWTPTQLQPLPSEPVVGGTDTTIRLVPYNCTKFRVTLFPVTKATWKK